MTSPRPSPTASAPTTPTANTPPPHPTPPPPHTHTRRTHARHTRTPDTPAGAGRLACESVDSCYWSHTGRLACPGCDREQPTCLVSCVPHRRNSRTVWAEASRLALHNIKGRFVHICMCFTAIKLRIYGVALVCKSAGFHIDLSLVLCSQTPVAFLFMCGGWVLFVGVCNHECCSSCVCIK